MIENSFVSFSIRNCCYLLSSKVFVKSYRCIFAAWTRINRTGLTVNLEMSGNFPGKFPEIYSNLSGKFRKFLFPGKFPEIFTKNTVQTFQIIVYLFTSSLSIGFYSTSGQ